MDTHMLKVTSINSCLVKPLSTSDVLPPVRYHQPPRSSSTRPPLSSTKPPVTSQSVTHWKHRAGAESYRHDDARDNTIRTKVRSMTGLMQSIDRVLTGWQSEFGTAITNTRSVKVNLHKGVNGYLGAGLHLPYRTHDSVDKQPTGLTSLGGDVSVAGSKRARHRACSQLTTCLSPEAQTEGTNHKITPTPLTEMEKYSTWQALQSYGTPGMKVGKFCLRGEEGTIHNSTPTTQHKGYRTVLFARAPITRRTTVPTTVITTTVTWTVKTTIPTTEPWTLRTTIPTTEPKPTIPTTAFTTMRTTVPGATTQFTTIKTTKIPTTVRPASETTIKQTAVPPGASTASETSGCLDDLYRCKGGGKCIDYKQVCDGTPDCPGEDDENIFCKDTSIPVVPIVAGVASVVALCVIVTGTVFFVKKRKRSQATRQAVNVDRVRKTDDPPANPPANPRDSHIYAAINPQDMDNNLTVISETPDRSKPRPDRRHNNTGNILQAPRDSNNYATPEDVGGTVYENIPNESPYQALNPDTMENAPYTSRS
ncbi:hypothetical protein Bbelb_173740 [Branchiostoma belcheri]|nr:hypothetical protein Bbelb_173740 [Branchiostoma belcheri]